MIRKTLIAGPAILAAACFACGSPSLLPPPPPSPLLLAAAAPVSPCAFDANKVVQSLSPLTASGKTFNAATYGNCDPAVEPHCTQLYGPQTGGPGLNASWTQAIQNAYSLAPPGFKSQLCELKYIYIDNNSGSPNIYPWGLRERAAGNIKHIGLPASLFSDPSYSDYESDVSNNLLGAASGTVTVAASPDSLDLKILAILAHEMGHILWWDHDVTNKSCGNRGKFLKTWNSYNNNPPHGFHLYGQQTSGNLPIEDFTFLTLQSYYASGDYSDLRTIYSDENWASLFAFLAPDEDLAETLQLWVLAPNLNTLTTTVPNLTTDFKKILQNSNSNLSQKVDWVANCL